MSAFTLRFETERFERKLTALGHAAPGAIVKALNLAGAAASAAVTPRIAQDMGLDEPIVQRFVKQKLATATNQRTTIAASAKRIPLVWFRATGPQPSRGRGTGVTAQLPGGRQRYPHAFIATVAAGSSRHVGVFERKQQLTRKSPGAWKPNLPIRELRGPSVWHVFKKFVSVGVEAGRQQLAETMRSEIRLALRRAR